MRAYEHTMMSYAIGIATALLGLYYNAYHFLSYHGRDHICNLFFVFRTI